MNISNYNWHWVEKDGYPKEQDEEDDGWFQEYVVMDNHGNFSVGFWREDTKAWDSFCYGWLENHYTMWDDEGPYFGSVVAWCPIPKIKRR